MRIIVISGLLMLFFASCYKEVDLSDQIYETGPVVSSFFAKDSLIKVYLLENIEINETSQRIYITDAEVKLWEDGIEVEKLVLNTNTFTMNGYEYTTYHYSTQYIKAKTDKTYQLKITTPRSYQVSSETFIPEPVLIQNVDTSFIYTVHAENSSRDVTMNFRIRFKDPEWENYYRITMKEKMGYKVGDSTIRVIENIPKYTYNSDSIFSFFGEDKENEFFASATNNFLIFSDKKISGQVYEIELSKTLTETFYGTKKGEFRQYIVELQSITEDEYSYLKSIDLQSQNQGFLSEPVLPFSNIKNGVGIFAGYSVSQKIITIGEYPINGYVYKY